MPPATTVLAGLALVALAAAPAAAERHTLLTGRLGLGVGNVDHADQTGRDPDGITVVGMTVSWEDGPMPYPAQRGYAFRGALVPELQLTRLGVDEQRRGQVHDATLALAAGLRLELGLAQREMGAFKVSARAGFFASARVGVLADADHTPLVGAALGEYLWVSDRARIGFELDLMRLHGQQDAAILAGGSAPARQPPWVFQDPRYTALTGAITFGGIL